MNGEKPTLALRTARRVVKLEKKVQELFDLLVKMGVPSNATVHQREAFECYHANENPFTCPCPKKCYCKDKTCKGKVSW